MHGSLISTPTISTLNILCNVLKNLCSSIIVDMISTNFLWQMAQCIIKATSIDILHPKFCPSHCADKLGWLLGLNLILRIAQSYLRSFWQNFLSLWWYWMEIFPHNILHLHQALVIGKGLKFSWVVVWLNVCRPYSNFDFGHRFWSCISHLPFLHFWYKKMWIFF
jgi:hypothetical protein